MAMQDSKRLFMRAAVLILAGALVILTYRLASPAKCDPTIQIMTFSIPSGYNTPTEYRAYDHGRLLVLEKSIHRKSLPFAVVTMVVQWLLWVPAMVILLNLGVEKSPLSWSGLCVLVLGVVIWITSGFTGINMMKTIEPPSAGGVATRAAPEK